MAVPTISPMLAHIYKVTMQHSPRAGSRIQHSATTTATQNHHSSLFDSRIKVQQLCMRSN